MGANAQERIIKHFNKRIASSTQDILKELGRSRYKSVSISVSHKVSKATKGAWRMSGHLVPMKDAAHCEKLR